MTTQQRITITATGEDKGYSVVYPVIVRAIEGVRSDSGPGGFRLAFVPKGKSARRETNGPMIDGPWGYLFGLAGIIDTYGGSAREFAAARDAGNLIERLATGDVLTIDGADYIVHVKDGEAILTPPDDRIISVNVNPGYARAKLANGTATLLYATYKSRPCGCAVTGDGSLQHPLTVEPCRSHMTGPEYNAWLDAEIAAGRAVPDAIEQD